MKKGFLLGVVVTLLILLCAGGAYYLGTQSTSSQNKLTTTEVTETIVSPTPQVRVKPTLVVEESSIPEGWLTYENKEYSFEISYPANYKVLDDEENLYGWPNAVVLIYGGGQSYDLPIEVWDTQAAYEAKYPNTENLIVQEVGGKFITLLNANYEPEVDKMIETFKETQ